MKMNFKALKINSLLAVMLISIVACDKDFSSIESDLGGEQNFLTTSEKFPIITYNKKLDPVQTNNLTSHLLGVYSDAIYGQTTASVVTQIVPTTFDISFGDSPRIESVVLSIPYYVTNDGDDGEGNTLYTLDSLFGSAPVKLNIFQNNYFLRDFDPESELQDFQIYYSNSNETINFNNHLGELLYEDDSFTPSASEIIIEELNEETMEMEEVERITPSLRVELLNTNEFWENLLFENEGTSELSNQNNFKDFFRGLYFKSESIGDDGHMMMMNFGNGNIIVNYSSLIEITIDENGEEVEERDDGVFRMNFTGNKLNIIEKDPTNTTIDDANTNANPDQGDVSLFLKGTEGSYAVVDLFGGEDIDNNGNSDNFDEFLNTFRDINGDPIRLINEANIVFYVDQNQVEGQEPDRVILYDLNSGVPIVDYFFDPSRNDIDPLNSRIIYSEILDRDDAENGVKYKIRLTEHLNNILLRDSTNVKLGLFVTTNVNEVQNSEILNDDDDDAVSTGTIMSPRGTVLHGSNASVPEDQRVQLEIYYTEPNN